jgi:hypothetical protein
MKSFKYAEKQRKQEEHEEINGECAEIARNSTREDELQRKKQEEKWLGSQEKNG